MDKMSMSLDAIIGKNKKINQPKVKNTKIKKENPRIKITKVLISNIARSVTEADMRIVLNDCGPLKFLNFNYGSNGQFLGTAFAGFVNPANNLKVHKMLNGITFDGLPLEISFLTTDQVTYRGRKPLKGVQNTKPFKAKQNKKPVLNAKNLDAQMDKYFKKKPKNKKIALTADELDAELEEYRKSMPKSILIN
jgi:RNA recognition motif-containing protein